MRSQKEEVAPFSVSSYLDPRYWDWRFSSEEHYEWFKGYSEFRHLIHKHVKLTDSVLELGCGNSRLSEELCNDGITEITCTDLSRVAVENMQKRLLAKGFKNITVMVADMLDLPFANGSFDIIIEKGAMGNSYSKVELPFRGPFVFNTKDVLLVDGGDPWRPHPETVNKVMAMLQGVHRVLKPGGIFISISFGQPHFRSALFEAQEFTWSIEWDTFGDGFHYFFYTLKKGNRSFDSNKTSETQIPAISLFQDELDDENYIFRIHIDDNAKNES